MNIFNGFAWGQSWLEKLAVVFWRIRGCDHDGNFCVDIGDEEHQVWYCFRCDTELK